MNSLQDYMCIHCEAVRAVRLRINPVKPIVSQSRCVFGARGARWSVWHGAVCAESGVMAAPYPV